MDIANKIYDLLDTLNLTLVERLTALHNANHRLHKATGDVLIGLLKPSSTNKFYVEIHFENQELIFYTKDASYKLPDDCKIAFAAMGFKSVQLKPIIEQ